MPLQHAVPSKRSPSALDSLKGGGEEHCVLCNVGEMDGKEGKGREKGGRSDANLTGSTLGGKDVGESASTNAFSHYCTDNDVSDDDTVD